MITAWDTKSLSLQNLLLFLRLIIAEEEWLLALGQLYKVSQIKYSEWFVIAHIMVTAARFQTTPGDIELRALGNV